MNTGNQRGRRAGPISVPTEDEVHFPRFPEAAPAAPPERSASAPQSFGVGPSTHDSGPEAFAPGGSGGPRGGQWQEYVRANPPAQEAGYRQQAEQYGYSQAGYGRGETPPAPIVDAPQAAATPGVAGYSAPVGASRPRRGQGAGAGDHGIGGAGIGGYVEGSFGQNGPLKYGLFQTGTEQRPHGHPPAEAHHLASVAPTPEGGFRGRGPRGYRRPDSRIEEDVCDVLCEDDYVDATEIEVKVDNGEVILSGMAPDRFTKRRAEELAESCRGVHDVQNRLRIRRAEQPT